MSATENSPPSDTDNGRRGLSKEAWVAISTISAALITAIVTLIIHLVPQKPASPLTATSAIAAPSTVASTPNRLTADAIAGKWAGKATDNTGESFEITLEVKKSCGINEKCGVMTVSHHPCYGEISLDKARDPIFEFDIENFYGESNREKCLAGPGEVFQLRPDGKLDYRATYEPRAEGVLERTNN